MCGRDQDFSGVVCIDRFTVDELSAYREWQHSHDKPKPKPSGCPSCGSPVPEKHPVFNGEVWLCSHEFHQTVTPNNPAEEVDWLKKRIAEDVRLSGETGGGK